MQRRRLSERELPRADHPEGHSIGVPVGGTGDEQAEEDEQRDQAVAAERPADGRQ
jgi:hypothetical protein